MVPAVSECDISARGAAWYCTGLPAGDLVGDGSIAEAMGSHPAWAGDPPHPLVGDRGCDRSVFCRWVGGQREDWRGKQFT